MPFQREHRESQAVAVALRQLTLSVGLEQKRQMHEIGACVGPAESLVEQHMERSRREPLLAAYHVGHLHEMVVHDIGQVIGGQVVGALVEHLVVENRGIDGHLAAQQVVHLHVASRLYQESHHVWCAGSHEGLHLPGGKRQGVAHLQAGRRVILEVGSGRAGSLKLGGGVESYVGFPRIEQLLHMGAVDVAALALLVGAVGATLAHTLVDLYAEPGQGFVDILLRSGHESLRVGVLDAENHVAAVAAREEIVIESGADASDVERPRGRGGESHSYFTVHSEYL